MTINSIDILILMSNADITSIILNGEYITGIDHHWEFGEAFNTVYSRLKYEYNKPYIVDINEDDYLTDEEIEKLWNRNLKTDLVFTEEEIDILLKSGNVDDFMDKVKEDLLEIEA